MTKRGRGKKAPDEKDVLRDILDEEEFLIDDDDKAESVSLDHPVTHEEEAHAQPGPKDQSMPPADAKGFAEQMPKSKSTNKKTSVKGRNHSRNREDVLKGLLREQNRNFDPDDGYIRIAPWKKPDKKSDDEGMISRLLSGRNDDGLPIPRKQRKPKKHLDRDIMRAGGGPDSNHKSELDSVFIKYPSVHRRRVIKLVILTILLVLVVILVFDKYSLLDVSSGKDSIISPVGDRALSGNSNHDESVSRTIPQNISFKGFGMDNDSSVVSVIGFLKFELVKMGDNSLYNNVYSIVDDYGDEIILRNLDSSQKMLFHKGTITRSLFKVTGIFIYSEHGSEMKVEDISETKRPTRVVNKTVVE